MAKHGRVYADFNTDNFYSDCQNLSDARVRNNSPQLRVPIYRTQNQGMGKDLDIISDPLDTQM